MTFSAQVFRILIASPSDVNEERDIAVRVIQEWNDLNAYERQIVLLPIRWETHSAPEYGKRPQEIINKQVVDYCDLLVGIFWTRVGTPTGVTDSGTIEEIERIANMGKPVMLYFSQVKQDPNLIEIDQLSRLREFKNKTFPKALVENYSGVIEFKEKLSKQIEIQLRTLLAERAESNPNISSIRPITDIVLHFAEPEKLNDVGDALKLKTKYIEIPDFDAIEDYVSTSINHAISGAIVPPAHKLSTLAGLRVADANKNYYRQRATSFVIKEFFFPIRFWLKNCGGIGARDVYIDLNVSSVDGNIVLVNKLQLPNSTPSKSMSSSGLVSNSYPNSPEYLTSKGVPGWQTFIDVKALQPQRELIPETELFIGAQESCTIIITAKIYADTLPEPEIQKLTISLEVEKFVINASDILKDFILPTMQ